MKWDVSLRKLLKRQSTDSTLDALSTPNTKSEGVGQTLTDGNRLGDLAEHYAITWLWDEGFEVFLNAGCTGAVDIVGIKNGEVYLFDVKMNRREHSHAKGRTALQKELGVQYILFDPATRKLRLQKHKE